MTEMIKRAEERFAVRDAREQNQGLWFLKVEKNRAPEFITWLRDYENYTHLSYFTAVDWIEQGIFTLQYMLHNYDTNMDLCVQVDIDRETAEMTTMHHLWPALVTYEQELNEMFGITFPGSPRQGVPFALEGWDEMPPMRRDFDTIAYSEERFYPRPGRKTEDPAEHMRKEVYPGRAAL